MTAPLTTDYIVTMAAYNAWMNEKFHRLCIGLSDAQRKEDRVAFFRSIHGTLNHLLYGDLAWLGRFKDGVPRVTRAVTRRRGSILGAWPCR